jgi:hypothetical protein
MDLRAAFLRKVICFFLAAFPFTVSAQKPVFVSEASTATAVVAKAAPAAEEPLTGRWLDLKSLSYSGRYRSTTNWHGRHLFEFGQQRYVAAGRIKLDRPGRYSVNFHASSGRYFNWSYADLVGGQYKDSVVAARAYKTPKETADLKNAVLLDPNGATYSAGIPSRGGYFSPRQLYFSATPVDQVTVEFGSLAIEHGQNTEITSFDDDGYIAGERVRIHDPKHLFFDQIAGTWAYLGSPLTPNFFSRGGDLGKSNYAQYLVEKKIGRFVMASTDFTLANNTHTMREGVAFKLPGAKVIDAARLELYQRTNSVNISGSNFANGSGFAASAHKLLFKRLNFEGGYASIDERYAVYGGSIYLAVVGFAWNSDSYETGKRVFTKADLKLGKGVTAFGFYTHNVAPLTIGHNQEGLNAGINIDLKTIANTGKRIF